MFDRPLKILLAASEVVPFAKTGGLADVAGSLPKALATVNGSNMDNDVRVVMPHYKGIEGADYLTDFPVVFDKRTETAIIRKSAIYAQYQGEHRTVPVYMVDNHHYFYRDGMYMFEDEAARFVFFCRALLEMLPRLNWQPDIIHCNDWQCGPIPLFLKTRYDRDNFYKKISTVFTIHNLEYQGNYDRNTLDLLELGNEYFTSDLLEFYGSVSFMKMGILYSDIINTVSKNYASEIQRPELGAGMDGLLRSRSRDLFGIINGINYHEFNPKTDQRIYRNYDTATISNKKENKFALQKEMRLPEGDFPVIGLITRLVDQKGLNLFEDIAEEILQGDIQLMVLGSGEPRYENLFLHLRDRFPHKVGVYIGFNSILAHRIYAGSDMFLMPSRYEPCGLGQLIAMRYGTIPIVRATGGLADTVHDYNPVTGAGNGFVFSEYDGGALLHSINRALKLYKEEWDNWQRLVRNAMELDFSWARSGVEYLQLYQEALVRKGERARTA